MRPSILLSSLSIASIAASASATVIGNQVFGDSYLVRDGATTYSVLDVYVKSVNNTQGDTFANCYGVSASISGPWLARWAVQERVGSGAVTDSARQLRHTDNSSWKPNSQSGTFAGTLQTSNGVIHGTYNHPWDSFVTAGLRYQSNDGGGATALQLTPTSFSNFGTANAGTIASNTTGTNGGAGWYPLAGGNASSNPLSRFNYYNGQTGAVNTAKAATTISGNGITVGQNLDNHFMIGRFSIDTADMQAGVAYTLATRFAMTVVSDGVTKSGAVDVNFRVNQSLTFAVPSPAAGAVLALAGVCSRRRRS